MIVNISSSKIEQSKSRIYDYNDRTESMQNIVFEKRVTNIKQKYDFQNK